MKFVTTQRERDTAVILNVVRNFGPLSRVDINRLTGLRASTISQLSRDLLKQTAPGGGGAERQPDGAEAGVVADQSGTGVSCWASNSTPRRCPGWGDGFDPQRSVGRVRETTRLDGGEAGLVDQLKDCARRALAQTGVSPRSLRGIGIADVGLVNRHQGVSILSSQLEFWRGVPLARIFEDTFGVPTFIDNATRCRGNAERLLGSGESSDDMIYVEYGAGIGAAIFSARKR